MKIKYIFHHAKFFLIKKCVLIFEKELLIFEKLNDYDKLKLIDSKLVNVYQHAFQYSPYLRNKYQKAGLSLNSIKGISDIKKIPLLTRNEITDNREEILTVNKTNKITINSTGGTTGRPMSFYRNNKLPYESFYPYYLRKWGLQPYENSAYVWRMKQISLPNKIFNTIFWFPTKKLKFDGTKLNKTSVKSIVFSLNKYKPSLIQGYAGSIYQLSKIMFEEGLHLKYIPKAIWITAAPLTYNEKKFIGNIFKSNVYNEYGSGEIPWIAFQKHHDKNVLHVNNYSRNLEIINKDDNGLGDVILTDFFDLSFPKIRYVIGDKAKYSKKSTLHTTIIHPVMGRESDYLLVPNLGKIDGSFLTTIFNKYPDSVNGFQFIQEKKDEIKLLVIPNLKNPNHKIEINVVLTNLNQFLSNNIKLSLHYVNELQIDRGKMRYVLRSKDIN